LGAVAIAPGSVIGLASINSTTLTVLETEHLTLRRMTVDDAEFILKLVNEPSFIRFIGDKGVRNHSDAVQYIQSGPMASYERFGFGLYLVELKEGRVPIGMCGLVKRDSLPDVDVGFAFLPAFWSKGYAFEAAAAVKAYGKDALGIRRLVAITTPENKRSIRLLEKIGLRFERMIRLSEDSSEIKLFASDV
jgi:RimJ/RimL family protein N-acetyltransferase